MTHLDPVASTLSTLMAIGSWSLSPPLACHEDSRVAMGCTATLRVCGPDPAVLPALVG